MRINFKKNIRNFNLIFIGGAAIQTINGQHYIVGVLSVGSDKCKAESLGAMSEFFFTFNLLIYFAFSGTFTEIYDYIDWIKDTMAANV